MADFIEPCPPQDGARRDWELLVAATEQPNEIAVFGEPGTASHEAEFMDRCLLVELSDAELLDSIAGKEQAVFRARTEARKRGLL